MKKLKRGDIYFADLSPVIGSEQAGVRPVLIIQNNIGNKFSPTTIVAAITSSHTKSELETHVPIHAECLDKESIVLLEQIRTIDRHRLTQRIGKLDEADMSRVDHAIAVSFGLDYLEE